MGEKEGGILDGRPAHAVVPYHVVFVWLILRLVDSSIDSSMEAARSFFLCVFGLIVDVSL